MGGEEKLMSRGSCFRRSTPLTPPTGKEKTTYPLSDELIGQLQNDVILLLLPPEFFTVLFLVQIRAFVI